MTVKNPDTVQKELLSLNVGERMTWREIARLREYLGIPPGTLCSIAKGMDIPKKYRKQLGVISPVPIIPCEICGEVHTHKHGEVIYDPTTQVVRPLRKPSPPRAPRIAIRKDDMTKAAETIVNNLTERNVEELSYYLKWHLDKITEKRFIEGQERRKQEAPAQVRELRELL